MLKFTTADRLKQIMDLRGLRQIDIVRLCEPYCKMHKVKMGRNAISQYVSGKVEPRQNALYILGQALNVSEAWLMGVDVPMEREPHSPSKPSFPTLLPTENTVQITRRTGIQNQYFLSDEQIELVEGMIKQMPSAPLYGEIAAQGAKLNRAYDIEDEITKNQKNARVCGRKILDNQQTAQ